MIAAYFVFRSNSTQNELEGLKTVKYSFDPFLNIFGKSFNLEFYWGVVCGCNRCKKIEVNWVIYSKYQWNLTRTNLRNRVKWNTFPHTIHSVQNTLMTLNKILIQGKTSFNAHAKDTAHFWVQDKLDWRLWIETLMCPYPKQYVILWSVI